MQLAKKTVLTNSAMTTLGTSKRILEDAIIDLHRNDNDNWAIGDIKTTTRTISDANWHKCDGSFMTANLSNDIKNTLTRKNQVKIQGATALDTTAQNYWNHYSDDNYMIISTYYSQSSGGGWVKLFVYTRNSAGNIVANSQKTLRSWSNKYSVAFPYPIIKCGNYYYTVVRYDDEGSGGLNTRYWHLYYTTNPTGSWSSRLIWSGGDAMANFVGLYTNGSQVRLEISNRSYPASSRPLDPTVYTFSGDGSNITSTTYTTALDLGIGRDDEYNIYPVGDGKYEKMQSSFYKFYKSSFTSNWTQYTTPTWADAVYCVYYINGKYYGLFKKKNVNNTYIFAIANSYTAFSSTALTNLTYYEFTSTMDLYRHFGRTNAGIWTITRDTVTENDTTQYYTYFTLLTEYGMKRKLLVQPSSISLDSNYLYLITNQNTYTAVVHSEQNNFKNTFYFVGLSYPDMTDEPYDAYMKIATN